MNYKKSNEKRQLSELKKTEKFKNVFYKLVQEDKNIKDDEKEFILLCAILFFKFYNEDKRFKNYFRLAYYIILKYSLIFKEYKSLYDISLQIGFYPICKTIINNEFLSLNSISDVISYRILETKFNNEQENYIETLEQNNSIKKLINSKSNTLSYIAPTSFGKSSLITTFIKENKYLKIGIIVPSKSLLIQTFRNVKKQKLNYKLILHDEMYENQEKFIGILTQERATRLINKGTFFDILFIDEAHKIFEYNRNNSRGLILSRLIKLNKIKNFNQKVVYLSPLIENSDNLKQEVNEKIESYEVEHNLKSEELYFFKDNEACIYDKFTGIFLPPHKSYIDEYTYIRNTEKNKNFIFHYSPYKIELFANDLNNRTIFDEIIITPTIQKVIDTLENEVHSSFYINSLIRKGIIYIHAKMPNIIKEYLEFQFKEIDSFKYLIANTVILEGINLPIDNLYILSVDRQNGKDITNLIGRVNRLKYVFDENNLKKLIANVHFVYTDAYSGRSKMTNHISYLRDYSFTDEIKNPLLSEYDINKLKFQKTEYETKEQKKEKRRKLDKEILGKTNFILNEDKLLSFQDDIKKYFIQNNIDDFYRDIDSVIITIENKINDLKGTLNFKNMDLVLKICNIFIYELEYLITDFEIERLKNEKAYNYYKNYLEYTQKISLKDNIDNTFKYFKKKAKSNDPLLFIGKTYGEIKRETPKYNHRDYKLSKVYIDLSKYHNDLQTDEKKLINLAIVKLKIEEDFVSFKLNKLINFLLDFGLITEDEYNIHTYGTKDKNLIKLSKIGLNTSIINKLKEDNQYSNITYDDNGNLITKNNFLDYLDDQSELFKFEVKKYL